MTDEVFEILQEKLDRLAEKNIQMDGFTLAIHLKDEENGDYFLDGYQSPITLEQVDQDAECSLTLSKKDMLAILNKKTQPMVAFSLGKIKLKGDMSVATNLMQILKF